jgi:hypothetical protein
METANRRSVVALGLAAASMVGVKSVSRRSCGARGTWQDLALPCHVQQSPRFLIPVSFEDRDTALHPRF